MQAVFLDFDFWDCACVARWGWRLFLFGRDDGDHGAPFHAGWGLDDTFVADVGDDFFEEDKSAIFVGDLAATEFDGEFGFVTFFEKAEDVIDFEVEVVVVGFGPQLDFFDLDLGGVFAGFFGFLLLLVLELSEVHELANGGGSRFSDFDEVKTLFFGHLKSAQSGDDTDLLAVSADEADFFDTDTSVDAGFFFFFLTDGLVSFLGRCGWWRPLR